MSTGGKKEGYIGYEYKELLVRMEQASFFIDSYKNFGWEPDENVMSIHTEYRTGYGTGYHGKQCIRLKRNRKIINKMELTRLQRNFEACVRDIEKMEKSKTSVATIYALITGIIGTAFMAGAVFAVTAYKPKILLCIFLAIPAFLGWILPYFIYRRIRYQQIANLQPYIEEKYDEIHALCEKGNNLLN